MKNEITIYELFGLVKDDKAPYQIKYDEIVYTFDGSNYVYNYDEFLFSEMITNATDVEFLNEKVEIISKENDWEDIEEINIICDSIEFYDDEKERHLINTNAKDRNIYITKINQLIKNQKKIIEKLEDKNENKI